MALPSGPSKAAETLVLQKAVEVLSRDGAISMEKLQEHMSDAAKRSDLADRIVQQGGLQMDKQAVVEALQSQLKTTEQVLQHKEGFLSKLWGGTKNVVGGTLRTAGKIITHPLVLTALLAIGGFYLWKHLNGAASTLEEAAGRFARNTQTAARRAIPGLMPPATDNLTQSGDGGSSVAPPRGGASRSEPPIHLPDRPPPLP